MSLRPITTGPDVLFTVTLPGRVLPKKSRHRIKNGRGGGQYIGTDAEMGAYELKMTMLLRAAWKGKPPLDGPLHVLIAAYQDTRRWEPDLGAPQETLWDCLQAAGVISNDKRIESPDGSRKVYHADGPSQAIIVIRRYTESPWWEDAPGT